MKEHDVNSRASRVSRRLAAAFKNAGKNPEKIVLFAVFLAFLGVMIVLPLANLFANALHEGTNKYWEYIADPDTLAAVRLSLLVVFFTIPLNLIFGVSAALCVARLDFPGKSLLLAFIDIPFSVSPVISGLIFTLVFGLNGWFGERLEAHGVQIIFAAPGIVIATIFITFPYIARELLPVLNAAGDEEEQAAHVLGANSWQIFYYITLPKIKWGLLYGVILCNARAMGEFGAVSVVSGHITGLTDTLPLRVEKLYNEYQATGAFAVASILAFLALITLAIKTIVDRKRTSDLQARKEEAEAPT